MTRKHPAQELEEDVLVRTSNMGQGRSDYEAFHTLSPAIHLREIHTHDFFELYIHLNGFPRLYVDNKIVTLQRGSLMIFPPFVMHGIISQDTIRNYERVVLFISSGMLHQLGQGLLPLEQRLLDCTRRTGYHYQLDEAALSLCTTCIDRVAQNTGDERPESRLADYAAMTEFLLQILRVTQEAPMLQSAQPSPDTIQRVMAYINEPTGRICSWGIPLAEAYGIRLPADYAGDVPAPLQLMDVPEGEYVVFEHGPFDYETENTQVETEIERAMKDFDYAAHGVKLDTAQGRVFYFYHDCTRFWKYVRSVKRVEGILGQ